LPFGDFYNSVPSVLRERQTKKGAYFYFFNSPTVPIFSACANKLHTLILFFQLDSKASSPKTNRGTFVTLFFWNLFYLHCNGSLLLY